MSPQPSNHSLSRRGTWRTLTVLDGLPEMRSDCVTQAADGSIWFSTYTRGACRYDGDQVRTFTTDDGLCGNEVMYILPDRQGRLWFATMDGGVCFLEDGTFQGLETDRALSVITHLFEDREGRMWVGGNGRFGFVSDDRFTDLTPEYIAAFGSAPEGSCWGIAQEAGGDIWLGMKALIRYDGASFTTYSEKDGLPAPALGYAVCQAAEEGSLWIGGKDGLARFDGRSFNRVESEITGVRHLDCDNSGRMWIGTLGQGVWYSDGDGFGRFTVRDGLPFDMVNSVHQDREGLIWMSTWGGGIACYDASAIQLFDGEDEPDASVLAEDEAGRIWLGMSEYVQWMGVGTNRSPVYSLEGDRFSAWGADWRSPTGAFLGCTSICNDGRGRTWFSTPTGLACHDGESMREIPLEGFGPSFLAADADGHLVFGRRNEEGCEYCISRYDGERLERLVTIPIGLRMGRLRAILVSSTGNIWAGFEYLEKLSQPPLWRIGKSGTCTSFSVDDGLAHHGVNALLEDRRGNLWVATPGGLSRFDGTRFETPVSASQLGAINSLCEDRQGRLWLGCDGGIGCFDGRNFQTVRSAHISMTWDIMASREGCLWLGTVRGLVRYTPSETPPRLHVQVTAEGLHENPERVAVTTATRQLLFEFKGLSMRCDTRDMLYSWQLVGLEEEWCKPCRTMHAGYADLTVGDYTFQVKAFDRDLNESETIQISLAVTQDTRDQRIDELEQRVLERTRELEEKNRALEQAAIEVQEANRLKTEFLARMSHDLRTPMNAIIGYARILLRRTKGKLEERQYQNLENIQISAHNLLGLINDILDLAKIEAGRVDVRPQDVDLHVLIRECVASVETLAQPGVELRQELDGVGSLYTDPDRVRRALMNLLGNALKFTEVGSITISVRADGDGVELAVADTGVGISSADLPHIFDEFRQVARKGSTAEEGTGLGLAIVRRSVELVGGTIAIDSVEGEGTTFTIKLKDLKPAKETTP